MPSSEIAHLELLAETDHLVERLAAWSARETPWQPMRRSAALVRRLLERTERLRVRLDAPLVVATFGGTGTGKSTLINAILGTEAVTSGRERPTTMRPTVICRPDAELEPLKLPLDELDVVTVDVPLLHDLVLIDCPDPDTGHADLDSTNLERLRKIVPYCDVLLYVSTQQKYRSQRVADELQHAAPGCRIVFLQTHADQDVDIRDDWKQQLSGSFDIADMFFVDSRNGLAEQRDGREPTGELGRLIRFFRTEMTGAKRGRIRRANVLDLIDDTLHAAEARLAAAAPQLESLEQALAGQSERMTQELADELTGQLRESRALWERRLVQAVLDRWGLSPFSTVLRTYHGLGSLLATAGLYRARSAAQLAILGTVQGTRYLTDQQRQTTDRQRIAGAFGRTLDDAHRREAELVIRGYTQAAEIEWPTDGSLHGTAEAGRVRSEFLGQAEQQVDEIVERVSDKAAPWVVRRWYDLLTFIYVAYVIARIGKNFFYDSFLGTEPILGTEFYIPATVFLLLWCGTLLALFLRRLQKALAQEIRQLAASLASVHMEQGLFPDLEAVCREAASSRDELRRLTERVTELRRIVQSDTPLAGRKAEDVAEAAR